MDSNKNALVLGASAGVGRAVAKELAAAGYNLLLVARTAEDLNSVATDLRLRFPVTVHTLTHDLAADSFSAERFMQSVCEQFSSLSLAVVTAGTIDEADDLTLSEDSLQILLQVNQLSLIKILQRLNVFMKAEPSAIVVCSSIAAAVPRSRNMAYTAAKTGLESYCRSLQHVNAGQFPAVEILRLGYVDTSMSFGKKLLFPVVSPDQVALSIVSSIASGTKRLRYFPFYWRWIVLALQCLPWKIYSKLKF